MTILQRSPVDDRVDELVRCLARMSELEVDELGVDTQARLLRALSQAGSALAAVRLRVLAAADRARIAQRSGSSSTGHWAAAVTRADAAVSHREVGLARSLETLPATRSALGGGEVSAAHAAVIAQALDRLPDRVTSAQREQVEGALVGKARELDPQTLRRAARRAIQAVEPDPAVVDAHEDSLLYDEETIARDRTRLTFHDSSDGTV